MTKMQWLEAADLLGSSDYERAITHTNSSIRCELLPNLSIAVQGVVGAGVLLNLAACRADLSFNTAPRYLQKFL